MGLLTDFYNTVAKFFRPQEDASEDASKSVATNRLKLVLMQDRTNLTPKILEQMRGELIDLLSKYLEMDKELLELNFEQEGNQVALMLSIPVIRAKDEEEIERALAEAAEHKAETAEECDSEADDSDEDKEDFEDVSDDEDIVSEADTENDTEGVNDGVGVNNEDEEVAQPVSEVEEDIDSMNKKTKKVIKDAETPESASV